MKRRASTLRTGAVLLLLVGLFALERTGLGDLLPREAPVEAPPRSAPSDARQADARADAGTRAILEAYRSGRSGLMVETEGTVEAVLRDDNHGSRHQRFILRVGGDHTVLVSHNIDLAPRVERIGRGDRLRLRGQYEWNEKGGVIHWTHHDPGGRRKGGWIEHEGRTYR